LFILIFCGLTEAHAQSDPNIPIRGFLNELETRFEVSFSYADSTLSTISLVPPSYQNLDSILQHIEERTSLKFEKLSERFIAIRLITATTNRSICGFVFDQLTKTPVADVLIYSNHNYVLSNEDGQFSCEVLASSDSIIIRMVGYETMQVPVTNFAAEGCHKLFLKQTIRALDQVIVTNYLTTGITQNVGGTFSIDTEELGMLPGLIDSDVLHSMQSLPGIMSFNSTVSNINIRGGTNDQNLLRWNGIRMYQSGHFFGLISAFNPYLSERVNVIKNGTSASLGKAVSGTIDITSDNDLAEKLSGTLGLNMLNGDVLLKIPTSKRSSIHLSARRSYAGFIQTPTYNQYFSRAFRNTELFNSGVDSITQDAQFDFYDVSFNYLLELRDNDKFQLNFLTIQNELTYAEELKAGTSNNQKTSSLNQQSIAGGLYYRRQWNPGSYTSLNLNFSKYNLNAVNFDITKDQRLIQENLVLDYGAHVKAGIILNKRSDLLLGYQVNEVAITNLEDLNNPDFRRLEREILRTHAFYGQGTYESSSGRSLLTLGIRTNYLDKFDLWLVEPRLSFTQRLSKKLSIELLGELKSQATSQIIDFQTDFLGVERRRWVLSNNADIPVIKSNQLSIGINYNDPNWLITLESYAKHVNSIITSSQGFQNQFQFIRSTGEYRVNGMDILINKKFKNNSSWISYAIAENKYTFDELQPVIFPNNLDITQAIAVGTSFTFNRWESSSGLNFRTGRPYTGPSPQNDPTLGFINYGSPNAFRLDHYLRLDLSAKYHFDISEKVKGQFSISLWNILNRDNTINIYYDLDAEDQVNRIEQKALGRTLNMGFRINF
jgi:hypothetical protein